MSKIPIDIMLDKAIERGFTLHHKTGDDSVYNFLTPDGLGLIVYPNTDEFEIYYNIDLCYSIKGGKCGSFLNDKHFDRHRNIVEKYMCILKRELD